MNKSIAASPHDEHYVFETHNDTEVGTDRTYLQGYVDAYYPDLLEKFGPPKTNGECYKTDAQWALEFADGTVATVYNWKNGINYCGADGTPVEDITEWHIGGHDFAVVGKVRAILEKVLLDPENNDDIE